MALMLIYIASILANITWMLLPGGEGAQSVGIGSPKQQASSSGQSSQRLNINSITSLNLFGDHQAVEVEPEPVVEEVTAAPVTNLNLKLTAVVAEGTEGGGSAIVESAGEQNTYGVGEKIKATTAVVHQVFHDRVILQVGNGHETLMLDGVEYDNRNPAAPGRTPDRRVDPQRAKKLSGNKYQASTQSNNRGNAKKPDPRNQQKVDKRRDRELARQLAAERKAILAEPGKITDFIRVSPVRKNGQLAGYRLNPASNSRLFKLAGLKANDLAVEINGYALNDMQQAMSVLRELREASEANIVVERNGQRTEILFSLNADVGGSVKPDPKRR